jgi:hypothetical protein
MLAAVRRSVLLVVGGQRRRLTVVRYVIRHMYV